MLQRYTAVHVLKIDCVGILRGKRRLVDQLKYPCRADARAFCSSVTTPEISLNGFVYWFA